MVDNLFADYIAAARRLGVDADFGRQVEDLQKRLTPIQIGRWGQLQEWEPDRDSRYCTHRHIQHLFAAFPGHRICPEQTPELAAAAVTSLEARGTGSSGWSKAWRMSIFARLQKPELFYRQLRLTPRGFHDTLVWEGKQQIDAPCGYASGVCEALLQSHRTLDERDSQYLIHLLPALPKVWPTGRVRGMRARGGFEVDMEWTDGRLTQAVIRNVTAPGGTCTVLYGQKQQKVEVAPGASVVLPGNKFK
jgi:alpha-L-fucosidase 2